MNESVYGPSWYAATAMAAPERDRLVYDVDVDVCVIGGGLAGLTAARELARRGWNVAVLEADRVAWNASGRNAGVVAPGFAEHPERIIERVGLERARALWILSAGGVDYVRSAIRETQMPGVSPVDGWLRVQRTDNPERLAAQAELIGGKLGTEVEVWSTEQVREVLKSPAYFQGLYLSGGFHIHPLNYALGLAAAAEEAGAKIFENTRALEIDPTGVRKRITTPGGLVRANHVVLAGSAHLSPLLPPVSGSVLPVASYIAVTAPLGERLAEAVTYAGAVADTRRAGDYYRVVDGSRLLWGSRITTRLNAPRRLANVVRRDMLKVYPQLGDVEITHAWTGTMAYAVHKMPQIGEVSRGLWVATAFGGHGLNTSAMAGELIARAIGEGDDRWRLFASYDLVYAGGGIGRAIAQALFWYMRARDAVEERIAWRRAATRRRREAVAARAAEEARQQAAAERLAAEAERMVAIKAAERAADEAARAAAGDARLRAADEAAAAARDAQRRAAEEAAAKAARLAQAEASRQEEAERAAQAERRAAEEAARLALEQAAREAAEQAAHIAAEEAAERIAREAARLAAEAGRLPAADEAATTDGDRRSAASEMPDSDAAASSPADESAPESRRRLPRAKFDGLGNDGEPRPRNSQSSQRDVPLAPEATTPLDQPANGEKPQRRGRRPLKSPAQAEFAEPDRPKD